MGGWIAHHSVVAVSTTNVAHIFAEDPLLTKAVVGRNVLLVSSVHVVPLALTIRAFAYAVVVEVVGHRFVFRNYLNDNFKPLLNRISSR